jgi:hypothetical protein
MRAEALDRRPRSELPAPSHRGLGMSANAQSASHERSLARGERESALACT